MKKILSFIVTIFCILLASCGGSSSGSSDPSQVNNDPNETLFEGTFVDYIVDGINYKSLSVSGTTDQDGKFLYKSGEELEFLVGDIKLGSAHGKNIITPEDLTLTESGGINIASFLISIDDDASADNGIQITDLMHEATKSESLNFNIPEVQFQASVPVNTIVKKITSQSSNGERNLVSSSYAIEHRRQSDRRVLASYLFKKSDSELNHSYPPTSSQTEINWNDWKKRKSSACGEMNGHTGIDFQTKNVAGASTSNEPFYSISNGEVIHVGSSPTSGAELGIIAIYDQATNKTVIYLHAREIFVNTTDKKAITVGQKLGIQGNVGAPGYPGSANTNEHVHVEVRVGKHTGPTCDANNTIDPVNELIGYIKNIPIPEPKSKPVTISGYVYNENGQPVNLAKVSTNLDLSTALTDSAGHFNLITRTEGGGNYASTPYTITIKTAKYQGYKNFSSSSIWGDNPTGQIFTLESEVEIDNSENYETEIHALYTMDPLNDIQGIFSDISSFTTTNFTGMRPTISTTLSSYDNVDENNIYLYPPANINYTINRDGNYDQQASPSLALPSIYKGNNDGNFYEFAFVDSFPMGEWLLKTNGENEVQGKLRFNGTYPYDSDGNSITPVPIIKLNMDFQDATKIKSVEVKWMIFDGAIYKEASDEFMNSLAHQDNDGNFIVPLRSNYGQDIGIFESSTWNGNYTTLNGSSIILPAVVHERRINMTYKIGQVSYQFLFQ